MKKLIIVLTFISLCSKGQGFQQQQRQVLVYNIAFSSLSGAIGSAINKHDNETIWRAALNGAWKGACGGALTFTGKAFTYQIVKKDNLLLAWPAKLIHSTGASMVENAAANKSILNNWSMEIGFIRLDIGNKVLVRAQPFALKGMIAYAKLGKFDFKNTLLTGTSSFKSNGALTQSNETVMGLSRNNSIIINSEIRDKKEIKETFAHELIHTYQRFESRSLLKWSEPINKKLKEYKPYKIVNKYIYLDYSPMHEIDLLFGTHSPNKNSYELEAYLLSERKQI